MTTPYPPQPHVFTSAGPDQLRMDSMEGTEDYTVHVTDHMGLPRDSPEVRFLIFYNQNFKSVRADNNPGSPRSFTPSQRSPRSSTCPRSSSGTTPLTTTCSGMRKTGVSRTPRSYGRFFTKPLRDREWSPC